MQGHGSEQSTVDYKFQSSFYTPREKYTCLGRYGKSDRVLYREEELSKTPWIEGKPPAYGLSFGSSCHATSKIFLKSS